MFWRDDLGHRCFKWTDFSSLCSFTLTELMVLVVHVNMMVTAEVELLHLRA